MNRQHQVAILVHTSTNWGTRLVQGISDYSKEHGPWLFYIEPRGVYEKLHLPKGWEGGGIIARVTSSALAKEILASGKPAVDVSWFDFSGPEIARCRTEESHTGYLAAEHLLYCGLRHFAVCGPVRRKGYSNRASLGFEERINESGFECIPYRPKRSAEDPRSWKTQLDDLVSWLKKLPKPIGIFAWYAVRGRQLTEACRYANINVPEEVAVIAGGYDRLMCGLSDPPLTTVDDAEYQVGYEAAALLDRLMAGEAPPENPILLRATGVTGRQSTDVIAINDELVRDAILFIREHAHDPISVKDVLSKVPLSRRMLEMRFRDVLGRSPSAEIHRVRFERVKHLLIETDLPIPRVASATGFAESSSLSRAFRKAFGESPSSYRNRHQLHAAEPGQAEDETIE